MDDLDDLDFPDEEIEYDNNPRLTTEWLAINALREMLGIALKGQANPTYESALKIGGAISPELLGVNSSLIAAGHENPSVLLYRQKAEAESQIERRNVSPIEIVDREIEDLKRLTDTRGNRDRIYRQITSLEKVRLLLSEREYTENQLILRDLFMAQRNLPVPPVDHDKFREFELANGRGLRIRLLHPGLEEKISGADLVYEFYWDKRRMARLAFVQYKIWDGNRIYFSNSKGLEKQLQKLKTILCDNGFCRGDKINATRRYRLPYCTAFLRPTDKLQTPSSRLVSSGLHIPICVVGRACENTSFGGKKIERKRVRSESVTHKVFEEMFNSNMLGSKWVEYGKIEQLYRKLRIFKQGDRLTVHAQEFGLD